MSWWDGTGREGYWESQVKRPSEDAVECPNCKQMAKRKVDTNDDYVCSNCGREWQPCCLNYREHGMVCVRDKGHKGNCGNIP